MAAAGLELDVLIEEPGWTAAMPDAEALCRTAAAAACGTGSADAGVAAGSEVEPACCWHRTTTGAGAESRLSRLRQADGCSSFPRREPDVLAAVGAEAPPPLLGDIVIALQTTLADAAREGKPPPTTYGIWWFMVSCICLATTTNVTTPQR